MNAAAAQLVGVENAEAQIVIERERLKRMRLRADATAALVTAMGGASRENAETALGLMRSSVAADAFERAAMAGDSAPQAARRVLRAIAGRLPC